MSHASPTAIVIPCYNEAERLRTDCFERFAGEHPHIRFVMVNDGSRDETLDTLHRLQTRRPDSIDVLDLPQNGGKAEAVRQGFLYALQSRPAHIGFWDADLATPLEPIADFVAVLNRCPDVDVVIGSRMPLLGRSVDRNRARRLLGRLFARVGSLVLGQSIYDTQCGAKLFRVTPATAAAFADGFLARWIFDVELFARLSRLWSGHGSEAFRRRVFEYPVDQWTEIPGSKLKKSDFVTAVSELARIYWTYLGPLRKAMPEPDPSAFKPAQPMADPATRRAA